MPEQAIQMSWDFAEGSPFGDSSSGFRECAHVFAKVIEAALGGGDRGLAVQANVRDATLADGRTPVVSTDPPYYDNIGYADLSDFFYVWLRRSLKSVFPELFTTLAVPKAEELVATPYRHGGKEVAELFFLDGMTAAMHRLAEHAHPAFPVTIYYAFKQSETESDVGTASTGWETFLAAVIRAGFAISGTWPMRTEGDNRQVGIGNNALASSIVLVCRPRASNAPTATRWASGRRRHGRPSERPAQHLAQLGKRLFELHRVPMLEVGCASAAQLTSSSRRTGESNSRFEKLRDYFAEDLRVRVIGVTPLIKLDPWRQAESELQPQQPIRHADVLRWLSQSPWLGRRWAALDDQAELYKPEAPVVICDPRIGLTQCELRRLDQLLGCSGAETPYEHDAVTPAALQCERCVRYAADPRLRKLCARR